MKTLIRLSLITCTGFNPSVFAVDEAAAEALARKSGCFQMPRYRQRKRMALRMEIAAKWKGKADPMGLSKLRDSLDEKIFN